MQAVHFAMLNMGIPKQFPALLGRNNYKEKCHPSRQSAKHNKLTTFKNLCRLPLPFERRRGGGIASCCVFSTCRTHPIVSITNWKKEKPKVIKNIRFFNNYTWDWTPRFLFRSRYRMVSERRQERCWGDRPKTFRTIEVK